MSMHSPRFPVTAVKLVEYPRSDTTVDGKLVVGSESDDIDNTVVISEGSSVVDTIGEVSAGDVERWEEQSSLKGQERVRSIKWKKGKAFYSKFQVHR